MSTMPADTFFQRKLYFKHILLAAAFQVDIVHCCDTTMTVRSNYYWCRVYAVIKCISVHIFLSSFQTWIICVVLTCAIKILFMQWARCTIYATTIWISRSFLFFHSFSCTVEGHENQLHYLSHRCSTDMSNTLHFFLPFLSKKKIEAIYQK